MDKRVALRREHDKVGNRNARRNQTCACMVVARETTLESRAGLVVEAFLRYAISTAHVLGVLATIAARFDLDGAWLAITGMAMSWQECTPQSSFLPQASPQEVPR